MRSLNVAVLVCLLVLVFGFPAFAQEEFTAQEADDFQGQFSMGIGLTGFSSSTSFVMSDAHGVSYDVMSLLMNEAARERMGVSKDQFADLWAVKTELDEKVGSMTLSATYSDEERDKLKGIFFEAESEMRSMLSADQFSALQFERARRGIEQVGAKYLAAPMVAKSLGLSEDTAKRIGKLRAGFVQQMKATRLEMLKAANEKLIKSLNGSQQEKMAELLAKETRKKFVAAELFVGSKVVRQKAKPWGEKHLKAIGLKSVQRKLRLSESQLERVGLLEKDLPELGESIVAILNDEQLAKLDQRTIRGEVKRLGTVGILADGLIGQRLGLSDEERKQLFEFGKDLRADLDLELEQTSVDLAVREFGLREDQAKRMSSFLR